MNSIILGESALIFLATHPPQLILMWTYAQFDEKCIDKEQKHFY